MVQSSSLFIRLQIFVSSTKRQIFVPGLTPLLISFIKRTNNKGPRTIRIRFEEPFKNPIRFINQKISLMSIIFYNYFENVTNKFYMSIKHDNKIITIRFQYGPYNISDLNQIIDDTIQEKFNITEKPIKLSVDVNRYAILIVVEENWEL